MQKLLAFSILSAVKIFSHFFYKAEFNWITPVPEEPWFKARLMAFLNHTSLYEPLFMQHLSFRFLWRLVHHISVPGADVTLSRPIVGRFWKLMLPNISSISRKRDESWSHYLNSIEPDSFIAIAPEGRMKRPNGLDKFGKKMTVRGGVADIIENLHDGGMILCLSGGLHHVQAPGQTFPRLFKKIKMNLAFYDIEDFKKKFSTNPRERKIQITQFLQDQLETKCPT
jgi:hypothetical protein